MAVKYFEEKLSGELKYDGKYLKAYEDKVRLVNGKTATRELVRHPGAVTVLPISENGDIVLVRQYRYPIGRELLEAPAGKLEKGEEPLSAAKRELEEETGFTAEKMVYLGEFYPTPGYCDEVIYIYLATMLSRGEAHPDEDEFIDVEILPQERVDEMIAENELCDGKTLAAIMKAKIYMNGGK